MHGLLASHRLAALSVTSSAVSNLNSSLLQRALVEVWVVIVVNLVARVVDVACVTPLLVTTAVPTIAIIVGTGIVIVPVLVR